MKKLNKTYSAVPTPFFDNNFEVDFDSFKNLIDFQIKNKINGIVSCGSTGEKFSLTKEEYREVAKKTVEFCGNKMEKILGCSDLSLKEVLENVKLANDLKFDGVLITNPCYVKAQNVGIIEYFRRINDISKVPVILYNVPSRTGQNMSDELIFELSKLSMVKGLKDATGDLSRPANLISLGLKDDFDLFSGEDATINAFNSQGGNGVISVVSNVFGEFVADVQENPTSEKIIKLNNLANAMFVESNPCPVKYTLMLKGIIKSDAVRLPLSKISDKSKDFVKKTIND